MDLRTKVIDKIKDKNTRSIGIVMHNKPDGDSIGSALALEIALKKIGKKVVDVIIHDKINSRFAPFVGEKRVNRKNYPPEGRKYDLLIMVDFSDPNRTMEGIRRISKFIIVIDHHILNKPYGDIYLCEKVASTGIIIYELIKRLTNINSEIANAIYLTLRSDTDGFTNSNTDDKAHKIASELLQKGANVDLVNSVYESKSAQYVKLMGSTLSEVKIDKKYKIAYLVVTRDKIKNSGILDEEVPLLINEFRYINDIDISFLFIEGITNVRVCGRSRQSSVNKVLEKFGGGGHPKASGCAFKDMYILDVVNDVLDFTIECIDKKII